MKKIASLILGTFVLSAPSAALADGFAPLVEQDLRGNWAQPGSQVEFAPRHRRIIKRG